MTDPQVCPIDGTPRVGAFRYCRTCNFDYEVAPAMPPAVPARPATASPPAPIAAPTPAVRPPAPGPATTPSAPPSPPMPPPPARVTPQQRELSAAERWMALTQHVDATQGWIPQPVDRQEPHVPVLPDPALGGDAVDESAPLHAADPAGRAVTREDRAASAPPEQGRTVTVRVGSGGAPKPVGAVAPGAGPAAARAAASVGAAKAVATAKVVGATVVREARRYDHAVATRWPKRRWLIHGATGLVALVLVAIPLTAAPPRTAGQVPSAAAPTPLPSVAIGNRIRIDDPENGSRHATDRVLFRGVGPPGAAVVQDVPLADDPRTTIGPDGRWSLEVALGPGENLVTLRLGDDRATQVVWSVVSTLAAPTPVPAPTPSPRLIVPVEGAPAAFKTLKFEGTGDDVVDFAIPQDAVGIAGIVHKAKGTFRVTALDDADQQTQVLVDHSGTYRGTSLFDLDAHSSRFRVEAAGAWSITLKPVGAARVVDPSVPIEAKGSGVARLADPAGPSTAAVVRHSGKGSFVLIAHRADGREALVEATGRYGAAIVVPEGTVLFEVVTLGEWSIAFG